MLRTIEQEEFSGSNPKLSQGIVNSLFLTFILYSTVIELSFGVLVGYWDLNEANETKDLSNNNNHGKIQGKPKLVVGKIQYGFFQL